MINNRDFDLILCAALRYLTRQHTTSSNFKSYKNWIKQNWKTFSSRTKKLLYDEFYHDKIDLRLLSEIKEPPLELIKEITNMKRWCLSRSDLAKEGLETIYPTSDILIYSLKYTFGRATYMPTTVCDYIKRNLYLYDYNFKYKVLNLCSQYISMEQKNSLIFDCDINAYKSLINFMNEVV